MASEDEDLDAFFRRLSLEHLVSSFKEDEVTLEILRWMVKDEENFFSALAECGIEFSDAERLQCALLAEPKQGDTQKLICRASTLSFFKHCITARGTPYFAPTRHSRFCIAICQGF